METLLVTNILDSKAYYCIMKYIMKNLNRLEWLKYIPMDEDNCKEFMHIYSLSNNVNIINSDCLEKDNLANIYELYQLVEHVTNEYKEYLNNFKENFEENVENMSDEIYDMWFKKKIPCVKMSDEQYGLWFDYVRLAHFDDFEDLLEREYYPDEPEFFIGYLKKHDLEHFIPRISEDSNEMLPNTFQITLSKCGHSFKKNANNKKVYTYEYIKGNLVFKKGKNTVLLNFFKESTIRFYYYLVNIYGDNDISVKEFKKLMEKYETEYSYYNDDAFLFNFDYEKNYINILKDNIKILYYENSTKEFFIIENNEIAEYCYSISHKNNNKICLEKLYNKFDNYALLFVEFILNDPYNIKLNIDSELILLYYEHVPIHKKSEFIKSLFNKVSSKSKKKEINSLITHILLNENI